MLKIQPFPFLAAVMGKKTNRLKACFWLSNQEQRGLLIVCALFLSGLSVRFFYLKNQPSEVYTPAEMEKIEMKGGPECVFCKIAAKKMQASMVYEDDVVAAFMDAGPVIKGHVLVVPKKHFSSAVQTPDDVLTKLYTAAKRIAAAQISGLEADGINIIQNNGKAAGQQIEHIHVHVIPRFDDDGHRWNWNIRKYDDHKEMDALAEKLRKKI